MSTSISIAVLDQSLNGIPNVEIEVWSNEQGTPEKLHTNTILTDSTGTTHFTTTDPDFLVDYPTIYCKLIYQSNEFKVISGINTRQAVEEKLVVELFTTPTSNDSIFGIVTHEINQSLLEGIQVDICDNHGDKINSTNIYTDINGEFNYEANDLFFAEKYPLFLFKLYFNSILVNETSTYSTKNNVGISIPLIANVTIGETEDRSVHGTIVDADGTGLNNYTIKAYSVITGTETLLGTTTTNSFGNYVIPYTIDLVQGGDNRVNLLVKVYNSSQVLQMTSPLILNSLKDELVNLANTTSEFSGISEFEKNNEELERTTSGLSLGTLTAVELSELSNRSGIDKSDLSCWVAAKHISNNISLDQDIIYALIKQGFEPNISSILLQPESTIREAITNAVENNFIKKSHADNIDDIIADIHTAISTITGNSTTSYKKLINLTSLTPTESNNFIHDYLEHNGSDENFWLIAGRSLSNAKISELKEIFAISKITQGNASFVEYIKSDFQDVYAITEKDSTYWDQYILGNDISIPDVIPGNTDAEKRENYARIITRNIEITYPTQGIIRKAELDTEVSIPNLNDFYSYNQDFEFRTENIEENKATYNYSGISTNEKDDLIENLKTLQRLYAVTPQVERFPAIKLLFNNNLHSSLAITTKGKANFVELLTSNSIEEEVAVGIYAEAEKLSFHSLMVFAHYTNDANSVTMNGIRGGETPPELEDLFGSMDYCSCKHCQSVYGPSAYLVDVFKYLEEIKVDGGSQSILEILQDKRADLFTLDLNCQNTNTQIPYIDIVNEVLENSIADMAGLDVLDEFQSIGNTKDLRAYPENINIDVYFELKDVNSSWNLPFNLWNLETKSYLEHKGVSRDRLIEEIPEKNTSTGAETTHLPIDAARTFYGITALDLSIITTVLTSPFNYFGGKTLEDIRNVSTLLEVTGISFDYFKELIETRFINHIKKAIVYDTDDACNLDLATFPFSATELDKLHRFVRLQRKTGWSVIELDRALKLFNTDIDNDFIVHCYYIDKIKESSNLSVSNILSWWGDMDTYSDYSKETSVYEQIYLNKSHDNKYDLKEYAIDNLSGSIAYNSNGTNNYTRSHAIASLGITENELDVLIPLLDSANITLPNLSHLYRMVEFCKTNNISFAEFIVLKEMIYSTPLVTTSTPGITPQDTFKYMQEIEKIKNSGWTIFDLQYLLKGGRPANSSLLIDDQYITDFLEEIRTELKKIREKYINSGIDSDQALWETINDIAVADAQTMSSIIGGTSTGTSTEQNTVIANNPEIFGNVTETQQTLVDTNHANYLSDQTDRLNYFSNVIGAVNPLQNTNEVTEIISTRLTDTSLSILNGESFSSKAAQKTFITNHQTYFTTLASSPADTIVDDLFIKIDESDTDPAAEIRTISDNLSDTFKNLGDDSKTELLLENLKTLLQMFLDEDYLERSLEIILLPETEPVFTTLSDYDFMESHFARFIDVVEANQKLLLTGNDNYLDTQTDRIIYVTENLVNTLMNDYLYQKFSNISNLDIAYIKSLFDNYLLQHPRQRSILNTYTSYGFVKSNQVISRTSAFLSKYAYFEIFYKTVLFIKHYELSIDDLKVIEENYENNNWLKFTYLPVYPATQSIWDFVTYEKWSKLEDALTLDYQIFTEEVSLFEYLAEKANFNSGDHEGWLALLSEITGWEQNYISQVASSFNFDTEMNDEVWINSLNKTMYYAQKLGTSPLQLKQVNKVDLENTESDVFRKLVKSTISNDEWLSVGPELRKPIREKQRDALVSYLLAEDTATYKDENDLYDHFLLDTQMSSCTLTSRIKQATLSTQLFIQRSMMGLEPNVTISEELRKEWEWSKQYRVWEANRKILLQPENYLEPELRKDKSEIFEEIEKLLKEDDINDTSVDKIYRTYLEGLNEVSNLEICTISGNHILKEPEYSVLKTGASKDVHVLARTKTSPHKYYYRKLENLTSWTPWEKLDLEINSDQISIVEWKNNVYVFWLEFIDKGRRVMKYPYDNAEPYYQEPGKYYEIGISWVVKTNNKWSDKNLSKDRVTWQDPWDGGYIYTDHNTYKNTPGFLDKSTYGLKILTPWGGSYLSVSVVVNNVLLSKEKIRPPKGISSPDDWTTIGVYTISTPHSQPTCSLNGFTKPTRRKEEFKNGKFNVKTFSDLQTYYNDNKRIPFVNLYPTNSVYKSYNKQFNLIYPSYYWLKIWNGNNNPLIDPFNHQDPIFHQDPKRAFMIMPISQTIGGGKSSITEIINIDVEEKDSQTVSLSKEINLKTNATETENISFFDKTNESAVVDRSSSIIQKASSDNMNVSEDNDFERYDPLPPSSVTFDFKPFYHPYAAHFMETLNKSGIEGLLAPEPNSSLKRQLISKSGLFGETEVQNTNDDFIGPAFLVTDLVNTPYPIEEVSFDPSNSYSLYNWELFYHIPMMIADKLRQNKKFEEAQKWYQFIFNPFTEEDGDSNNKYWMLKPFLEDHMDNITNPTTYNTNYADDFAVLIDKWRNDPFNPHMIAMQRPLAYMKNTVMKYLDNLIEWGDHLFTRDTMESINEATQIYILAARILGKAPQKTRNHEPDSLSYDGLSGVQGGIDDFGNAIVEIIDIIWRSNNYTRGHGTASSTSGKFVNNTFSAFYFGYPKNDKLLSYWDTVADRLFKIRHCQNIKGVERQLALFEPPIDPALIAKALAGGLSLSEAISDLNAPTPHYRFNSIYHKALELTNEVKSMGQSLLSALEKKDAESLSLIRAGHELKLQSAITQLKKLAIEDNVAQIDSLKFNQQMIEQRIQYYDGLMEKGLIIEEDNQLSELSKGNKSQRLAQQAALAGQVYGMLPNFTIGIAGGFPVASQLSATLGGSTFMQLANIDSSSKNIDASTAYGRSNKAGIMAGHARRKQEWQFQMDSSQREIEQINKQIIAAEIRKAMAERELQNHEIQMEHSEEYFEYLSSKFTNEELYSWMTNQISDVYFQSYQMATELAKKAEKAYQFETTDLKSSFITNTYWDSLKKGLLAGEKLQLDLRRLELSFMDKNKRRLELSKNVSLAQFNPTALIQLKQNGKCFFDLTEMMFDLDFPGQYMRRIKSVSMTIPAVTGPNVNINCKLSLTGSRYRKDTTLVDGYAEKDSDSRFIQNFSGVESIATSSAQNDSGMFQLNFNDERYLPFEGAGAISSWFIELPGELKQFDPNTISDVILHINYTALEDGGAFKEDVKTHVRTSIDNLLIGPNTNLSLHRAFSMKSEFASEIHQLINEGTTDIAIFQKHFPYFLKDKTINIGEITSTLINGYNAGEIAISSSNESGDEISVLTISSNQTNLPLDLDDLIIIIKYTV